MTEQRHQRLQRHARVDEAGRVGVPELVGGDVQGVPVVAAQSCRAGCVVESVAQPVGAQAAAAVDEQEVG
jgi:hypothetical protein